MDIVEFVGMLKAAIDTTEGDQVFSFNTLMNMKISELMILSRKYLGCCFSITFVDID